MQLTNVQLHTDTEQKIREFIPYIHSDEDMTWATNWVLIMGLAMVKVSLEKHPHLSVGDLINMTMTDKFNVN